MTSYWSFLGTLTLLFPVFCISLLKLWLKPTIKGTPYPPGPTRLPLIGSVHRLPQKYQEITFMEWGMNFGLSTAAFIYLN